MDCTGGIADAQKGLQQNPVACNQMFSLWLKKRERQTMIDRRTCNDGHYFCKEKAIESVLLLSFPCN